MNEQERQNKVGSILQRLYAGAKDTLGEGREDHREVLKRAYERQGQDIGANKINQMLGVIAGLVIGMLLVNPKHEDQKKWEWTGRR